MSRRRSDLSFTLTDRVDNLDLRSGSVLSASSRRKAVRSDSQSSQETYQPLAAPGQAGPSARSPPLTGPDSLPAPALLTHSELGSRWLKEQSKLVRRKVAAPSVRRYESDEESAGSDEGSIGDLSLVRDARGRYYYSYGNAETASLATRSDVFNDHLDPASSSLTRQYSAVSPPGTPLAPEFPAEPILAPDCSGCGVRLSYMRYTCVTCGEGEMWKENDLDKVVDGSGQSWSEAGHSDESDETHLAYRVGTHDSTRHAASRPRSTSTSTRASRDSMQTANGVRHSDGETPAHRQAAGYELCPSCIEVRGLEHSRAAGATARHNLSPEEWSRLSGDLRHTFREKVWGPQGWQDVGESPLLPIDQLFRPGSWILTGQNTTKTRSVPFAARSCSMTGTSASRATSLTYVHRVRPSQPVQGRCRVAHTIAQAIARSKISILHMCFYLCLIKFCRPSGRRLARGLSAISLRSSVSQPIVRGTLAYCPAVKHPGAFCHK